jgi:hypothetical protein
VPALLLAPFSRCGAQTIGMAMFMDVDLAQVSPACPDRAMTTLGSPDTSSINGEAYYTSPPHEILRVPQTLEIDRKVVAVYFNRR